MSDTTRLKSTIDRTDTTTIEMDESGAVWFRQDEDIVILDPSQLDQLEHYLKGRRDRLVKEQMEANIKAYEDGTRPEG